MKFLTNHSKIFYIIFIALVGALLISATVYASNYVHIHVFYDISNGTKVVSSDLSNSVGYNNEYLYAFFEDGKLVANGYSNNFDTYVPVVLEFQDKLNAFNTLFVSLEFACVACIAILFVLANHSRRIYYNSNLVGGILIPLAVIVMNLVLLFQNLSLMGIFNKNYELFNIVAVLQNPKYGYLADQKSGLDGISQWFNCNSITFIVYMSLFIVVIAYSAFMAIYSILKYKATAEERKNILEKVVTK